MKTAANHWTLMRWRLSLAIAGAVVFGMVLQRPVFDLRLMVAALGGFLGCGGCSALNQWQERERDALMTRTRHRPLAGGQINPALVAMLISLLFLLSGVLLYLAGTWRAVGLIVVIIFLYNGLYTMLKGRTVLFLFPGAAAGALPPMLGWLCAGGSITHPTCLIVCAIFLVGQFPHFWLVAERYADDYARAGIRFPWQQCPVNARQMQVFWLDALALTLVALPVCGVIRSLAGQSIVSGISMLLTLFTVQPGLMTPYLVYVLNGAIGSALAILLVERIL